MQYEGFSDRTLGNGTPEKATLTLEEALEIVGNKYSKFLVFATDETEESVMLVSSHGDEETDRMIDIILSLVTKDE
jgi:hypothetical protein